MKPARLNHLVWLVFLLGYGAFSGLVYAKEASRREKSLYISASGAYNDGFYDIAIPQLESFLEKYPDSDRMGYVHLMLGESCFISKKPAQALGHYLYLKKNRQLFQKYLPEKISRRIGECYFRLKEYGKAAPAFSEALIREKNPQIKTKLKLRLAASYYFLKNYGKSFDFYRELFGEKGVNPYRERILSGLCNTAFLSGRASEGLSGYRILLKEFPKTKLRSGALYRLAAEAFQKKKYAQSLSWYEKALREFPRNKASISGLLQAGIAAYYLKDDFSAIKYLEKYIRSTSDNRGLDNYQFIVGMTYYRQKLYKEAIKSFEELLDRYPGSEYRGEARYNIGVCRLTLKNSAGALKDFKKILASDNPGKHKFQIARYVSNLLFDKKQYNEAIKYFTIVMEGPDREQAAEAWYWLSEARVRLKQTNRALINFRLVSQRYPDQLLWADSSRFRLGEIYYLQGNLVKAERWFHPIRHPRFHKQSQAKLKEIRKTLWIRAKKAKEAALARKKKAQEAKK